jgi:N-dimethylarginine dimethylaminohydrolase
MYSTRKGCDTAKRELSVAGFTPVEIDVGEFLKAGGSVSYMKLTYW